MNKKMLFALSVAVVVIVTIGTVSAFDLSDLGSIFGAPKDQEVTIDGENFTIPGTFKENENISNNGSVNDYYLFKVSDYGKGYTNGTDYINILISDYNTTNLGDDLINYMNGTSKNISGVKGFLYFDDLGYTYTFAKDNKVISIQSDNEELIAPVIA
jgi:hypothetical protein